ncbi:MAG: carboxypeptidase-like regulatory domain-containing protein [Cyclobacteriaceae bacterium]|nr:carboxypeptidase-like regulatory domain-containing protein [Cyclobacteriaceae bacterium]MCH8516896.1 carboxypeptidase-like regulatory domain-containing protein [Cyclobacteriaceae bacterium]
MSFNQVKFLFFNFFVVLFIGMSMNITCAQVRINGQVFDKETKNRLSKVTIILTGFEDKIVLSFTETNPNGKFDLNIPSELDFFTLTFRKSGYESLQTDLILADLEREEVDLEFALIRSSIELDEIIVQAKRPPIIIKSDTIIFDVAHYERRNDQNLEDILGRIPGFKVLSDGELEYNGRRIQKVVIDGKELTNAGASLITKTITAQQIENIELRTKEQSNKLKNSILDENDFMVLDIKIKEEYKNKGFGKLRGTLGYQDKLEPGVYGNGMVFKDRVSVHAFAEHDRLGNEEISLMNVQNIGEEAFKNLFSLPADFDEFKSREGYQEELYGFKDYVQKERTIAGLTSKIELSENASVFIGSYNVKGLNANSRETQQLFFDDRQRSILQIDELSDFQLSKNKVEFRYDQNNIKLISDLNYVYKHEKNISSVFESSTFNSYRYTSDLNQKELYFNNKLEYFFVPEKWAISTKLSFANVSGFDQRFSTHNDSLLRELQGFTGFSEQTQLQQNVDLADQVFAGDLEVFYRYNKGNVSGGVEILNQELTKTKRAFENSVANEEFFLENSLFNLDPTALSYTVFRPNVRSQYRFDGSWTLSSKFAYAYYHLPQFQGIGSNKGAFELDLEINFRKTQNNFTLGYNRSLQMFSLSKVIGGYDLLGFRNIGIPTSGVLEPQIEEVAKFSYSAPVRQLGMQMIVSSLAGRTFNGNVNNLQLAPIVQEVYDQLESSYLLGEIQLQWPIANELFLLEQINSLILQRQENLVLGANPFLVDSRIIANELNLRFTPDESVVAFDFENKFNVFDFSTQFSEQSSMQSMFSTFADIKFVPKDRQWTIGPYIRRVWFLSGVSGTFTDVGGEFFFSSSNKKWNFRLIGYNLLNNRNFIRQQALPLFFEIENEGVFSRFGKFELEYRF